MVEAQYEASLHNLHEHRMYSHTPYVHINSFIDIHVPPLCSKTSWCRVGVQVREALTQEG